MKPEQRIREALDRGERDAQLLDGRGFDRRYWTTARQAVGILIRRLEVSERERAALVAYLAATQEEER